MIMWLIIFESLCDV